MEQLLVFLKTKIFWSYIKNYALKIPEKNLWFIFLAKPLDSDEEEEETAYSALEEMTRSTGAYITKSKILSKHNLISTTLTDITMGHNSNVKNLIGYILNLFLGRYCRLKISSGQCRFINCCS